MKRIIIIALLLVSSGLMAQQKEPVFEKVGDKVLATYFHANGAVAQQGFFVNEKLQGEWTMFNDKGEKIAIGNYDSGVRTGTWLFWDGEVVKEVDFQNNKIAAIEEERSTTGLVKN
jgi:antitoxin component YwqK of YwqJK toxin-antitoxin module